MRYLLTIEYVGTAYAGSQKQPKRNTVQVRSQGTSNLMFIDILL